MDGGRLTDWKNRNNRECAVDETTPARTKAPGNCSTKPVTIEAVINEYMKEDIDDEDGENSRRNRLMG